MRHTLFSVISLAIIQRQRLLVSLTYSFWFFSAPLLCVLCAISVVSCERSERVVNI